MTLAERLKNMDAHSSVSKEFRVYTAQGAVLSVVTLCIILYLVTTELYFNFQVTLEEKVHVNATSPRGIEMEFDLTLPRVPCSYINVDASDPAGQSQSLHLDLEHHLWKHRIKMDEQWERTTLVGQKTRLEMGSTMLDEAMLEESLQANVKEPDEEAEDSNCGPCYGAGEEGECCNTCEDVKRAYRRKGWHLEDSSEIKQCRNFKQGFEDSDEGCNIHGIVALSSGGGNLHLAPGRDFESSVSGDNIMELLLMTFQQWNVSHTVKKLRFGPEYPAGVYQLDGQKRVITDSSAMYQYYIQVVPTRYRFRNGTTIQTNQYSVTEHVRHISPGSSRGLPGVFFFYEVSPLHVEISEVYRKGWIAFFTSVCAIIGGVVTLMGMLDQYLFSHKGKRRDSLAM